MGCLAVVSPRLVLFLVWLFGGGYVVRPYGSWVWPVLGFMFFPMTTLAFAYASNSIGAPGQVTPFGWLLTAIALLIDIGLVGGGHSQWRRSRETDGSFD